MIAYDPRGMSWPQYSALMAELFAAQQLGTAPEEQWQDWVERLLNQSRFPRDGVPPPQNFAAWQEWAQRVCGIIDIQR